MEVRVVNDEYIVLKDMFSALGRVRSDGTWTDAKNRMIEALEDVGKLDHHEKIVGVKVKKNQYEDLECLKLDTVPIILTQFKPSWSKKKTEEENKLSLNIWRTFMRFVDSMLVELEVHKYIVYDKSLQREAIDRLYDADGKPAIANSQVSIIMAKLIGVYDKGIKKVNKDNYIKYRGQTTVDLLQVHQYVLDKFVNAFEFTGSHKEAAELTLKLAEKKYGAIVKAA